MDFLPTCLFHYVPNKGAITLALEKDSISALGALTVALSPFNYFQCRHTLYKQTKDQQGLPVGHRNGA